MLHKSFFYRHVLPGSTCISTDHVQVNFTMTWFFVILWPLVESDSVKSYVSNSFQIVYSCNFDPGSWHTTTKRSIHAWLRRFTRFCCFFTSLTHTHTQVHTHTGTHRHKRTQANTHTHISAQTNTLTHRHRDTETRTCKHWQIYPNLFWALQVRSSPSFLILEIKFWSKYLNNAMKLNLIKLKTTLWETQSIDTIF